ncbi:hypothetical protein O59_000743 [Cellvibrio sp. BR]|nr:hypothetical protein O59_000743 [Cellvibrio sp. BR]
MFLTKKLSLHMLKKMLYSTLFSQHLALDTVPAMLKDQLSLEAVYILLQSH